MPSTCRKKVSSDCLQLKQLNILRSPPRSPPEDPPFSSMLIYGPLLSLLFPLSLSLSFPRFCFCIYYSRRWTVADLLLDGEMLQLLVCWYILLTLFQNAIHPLTEEEEQKQGCYFWTAHWFFFFFSSAGIFSRPVCSRWVVMIPFTFFAQSRCRLFWNLMPVLEWKLLPAGAQTCPVALVMSVSSPSCPVKEFVFVDGVCFLCMWVPIK